MQPNISEAAMPYFIGLSHNQAVEVLNLTEFQVTILDTEPQPNKWDRVEGMITIRATGQIAARFAYLEHPQYVRELVHFRMSDSCRDMNVARSEDGYWF